MSKYLIIPTDKIPENPHNPDPCLMQPYLAYHKGMQDGFDECLRILKAGKEVDLDKAFAAYTLSIMGEPSCISKFSFTDYLEGVK